jgi:hypothetical protein
MPYRLRALVLRLPPHRTAHTLAHLSSPQLACSSHPPLSAPPHTQSQGGASGAGQVSPTRARPGQRAQPPSTHAGSDGEANPLAAPQPAPPGVHRQLRVVHKDFAPPLASCAPGAAGTRPGRQAESATTVRHRSHVTTLHNSGQPARPASQPAVAVTAEAHLLCTRAPALRCAPRGGRFGLSVCPGCSRRLILPQPLALFQKLTTPVMVAPSGQPPKSRTGPG